MCTEMLVDGDEITRDGACWCALYYDGESGKEAHADLGARVHAALDKEVAKACAGPHDESKREVSVTVTVRRW